MFRCVSILGDGQFPDLVIKASANNNCYFMN